MRKWYIVGFVLMLALALVGCSSSTTTSSKKTESADKGASTKAKVMKVASVDKKEVAMGQALYKFKDILEKETNGSIKVEVYPDSQLGGERDIFEGVQLGTIQAGSVGAAVTSNFAPAFNLWSLPFLFPTREDSFKVLDGPVGQEVLKTLDAQGVVGLAYWESGIRNLTNNKKEIKTPDDVKGLKIRTMESPIQLDIWKALGANPTPIAFNELFTSLQQGVIDGQENPYSVIAENKIYEVQKYVTETEHLLSVNPFLVNKKFYDSLTDKEKAAVKKAAEEARDFERKQKQIETDKYKKELKDKGVTITTLTPAERKVWVEKVQPVYDKYKGTIGEELVNKVLKEVR